jgi:hypothetical protein
MKTNKLIFAINAEDVEYIESVRVYNVKIDIETLHRVMLDYCFFCGKKLKRKINLVSGKRKFWF